MSRSPAPFSRVELRQARQRYLRRHAVPLIGIALLFAALGALMAALASGWALGLIHGLLIGSYVLMLTLSFLLIEGMTFKLSGAWGEENTRDVLKRARRRGAIWDWVDGVEIWDGDIDHLVLSRIGVLAIDTKWHSHGMSDERVHQDAQSALAVARRSRSVLRSLKHDVPVRAMVVVWGGDASAIPEGGHLMGEVFFLRGHDLGSWLHGTRQADPRLGKQDARAIANSLRAFRRRSSRGPVDSRSRR